jgi:GMP synthase (glutamine-hydrolysing)
MRIACLQHVSFEGPGNIANWATERGHSMKIVHVYDGANLPKPEDFDLLVVMGGPMSVNDESEYPWLVPEKKLVRECLNQGTFVLGVCLGSQIMADCLGSRVYRNRVKEIGWFPIRLRPEASHSALLRGMAKDLDVMHWHGETYDLPAGCVHLAASDGCAVQAFEHPSGLGLQFHLEMTAEGLHNLISHFGAEIGSGPYEQPVDKIVSGETVQHDAMQTTLFRILDRIEERIAGGKN